MADKPEWVLHLEWSVRSTDPVPTTVSDAWLDFDIKDQCFDNEYRRTAMKYAATAALNGWPWYGYLIARSTQLHNAEAIQVIEAEQNVHPGEIAGWLRSVSGDLVPLPDPRPAWNNHPKG